MFLKPILSLLYSAIQSLYSVCIPSIIIYAPSALFNHIVSFRQIQPCVLWQHAFPTRILSYLPYIKNTNAMHQNIIIFAS